MQLDRTSDLKEVEAAINEFQQKLDRLKVLYEQYFMGIEKREPLVPLKDVVRVMRELDGVQIRNTGLKFRFRGLVQKLNSYKTYWNRTIRAIENGTYHRDLARVRRNMARKGIEIPKATKLKSVADVERALAEAARLEQEQASDNASPAQIRGVPANQLREQLASTSGQGPVAPAEGGPEQAAQRANSADGQPQAAPRRPAQPPPVPAAQQGGRSALTGISEQKMQSIYRRFIKAKKLCGEDTTSVRYESIANTINKQLPKIRKQYGDRDVDFKVVIRSGRAVLKAKVK